MINVVELLRGNTQYWSSLISDPWRIIINSLDIILVTLVLFLFIKRFAGTKMMILVRGVVLFTLLSIVAGWLGLQTLSWMMNQILSYGVIAAVVLFSPEIRSALEKLGRTTKIFTASAPVAKEEKLIQACLKATDYMCPRKIGALVSIQRFQTLQEYIASGIPLNADVSSELLINLFIPNTPLHDGAVIIQEDKAVVACAYLPLSETTSISKEFGTRHRAAIGLSEQTDAFTFVVSEETGKISVARNGVLKHDLSRDEFQRELKGAFEGIVDSPVKQSLLSRLWKKGE